MSSASLSDAARPRRTWVWKLSRVAVQPRTCALSLRAVSKNSEVFIPRKHPRDAASLRSPKQTGVAAANAACASVVVVAVEEEAFHE